MITMKKWLAGGLLVSVLFCSALVAATAITAKSDEERVRALLERAVAYYQEQGERAFAAFSRVGQFSEDDLYVFVVDRNGTMLASGGPSRKLIGRDISPLLDDQLQLGFEAVLAQPQTGSIQQGEYRWTNWRQGRVERKKAFYQILDAHIIAVGYYLPRATPADARNMLERVVAALGDDAEQTIGLINQLDSQFYQDDTYPVIIDSDTGRFVAHGYNHGLVGSRFDTIDDNAGEPLGAPLLKQMENRDTGEFQYQWRNPATQQVESKTAFIQRVGRYLVLVGWYSDTVQ
ncbi:cache domain-containing protein [Halopseudomonas xiamenensis]|uniref:cache domain-containing protein n=1 Tax=Halopseudomonas xiamenensis TaxID=157792 RepID=UPI0016256BD8|nr:cache domain-containing protein [Halopseudomonas xiamenensis]